MLRHLPARNDALPYQTPEPILPPDVSLQRQTSSNDEPEDEALKLYQLQTSVIQKLRKSEASLEEERRIRARERDQANKRIIELEEILALKASENTNLESRLNAASETIASLRDEVAAKDAEIAARDADTQALKDQMEAKLRSLEEELKQAKEIQETYPEVFQALLKIEAIYLKHTLQAGSQTAGI